MRIITGSEEKETQHNREKTSTENDKIWNGVLTVCSVLQDKR